MNISIVITTYNAKEFIIDTLLSIHNQTYQNIEVVIVDDGSTDETVALMQAYIKKNSSLKISLFLRDHIGRAAALNYAIAQASFDWIAIIDADDLWNKNKLALQVHYIVENNLDFLATSSKIFFENSEIDINEAVELADQSQPLLKISLSQMLYYNLIAHSSILIKKNLAKYNLKRNSQIDYEMFLRLLHQNAVLYLLNLPLVYHRIHSKQSFEAKNFFSYALSATGLQLKYCFLHMKLLQTFFVFFKLGYYMLPKRLRFKLRSVSLQSSTLKKLG